MTDKSDELYDKIFKDFPDGFLASPEIEPRDTRPVLHVYDIRVEMSYSGKDPEMLLLTLEDYPGKVFNLPVTYYEVIQFEPKMVRINTGRDRFWILSDNLSDELRVDMRNEREIRNGTQRHLSEEEDPPLRSGKNAPKETVTVTAEDREDPEIEVRAKIVELLKENP